MMNNSLVWWRIRLAWWNRKGYDLSTVKNLMEVPRGNKPNRRIPHIAPGDEPEPGSHEEFEPGGHEWRPGRRLKKKVKRDEDKTGLPLWDEGQSRPSRLKVDDFNRSDTGSPIFQGEHCDTGR